MGSLELEGEGAAPRLPPSEDATWIRGDPEGATGRGFARVGAGAVLGLAAVGLAAVGRAAVGRAGTGCAGVGLERAR